MHDEYTDLVAVADYEAHARDRLAGLVYDYFAGGADDEGTVAANTDGWRGVELLPHVLRDVSAVTTQTTVLGTTIRAPILVGPTGHQRLAHPDGEAATARGAASFGTVFVVPTFASVGLEEVASAAPDAPLWFQLYIHRDRALTAELVSRAEAAGYRAIVLTVDVPVMGNRRRDVRNAFALPDGVTLGNFSEGMVGGASGSAVADHTNAQLDPSVTVEDLAWLRERTDLPVLVKGVMRVDDAEMLADLEVDGLVVSNHGGRQLDGSQATASALEPIARAVADRCEVHVDGGVRNGVDILRALALGARSVWIGRPSLWGLAVGGEGGVVRILEILQTEFQRSLALCGVTGPASVGPELLARHANGE